MDSVEMKTVPTADGEQVVASTEPAAEIQPVEIKIEAEDEQFHPDVEDQQCSSSEIILDTALKSEIDIEPTQLEEPREPPSEVEEVTSSENTVIKEPIKLYDIDRLRKFGDVPLVIRRMDLQDVTISYTKAVSSVEKILEQLRRNKVPEGVGIALRIANHTPSSCILMLAILNHKCHFHSNDKMILSKALHSQMRRAGMEYLIVNGYRPVGAVFFECLDIFLVYNEDYKLFKIKPLPKEVITTEAKSPLPANMCYSITTTGTTGTPKLIHVPYECIEPNIMALSIKLSISMADIIYLGTPCTFDPSIVEFFLALQNGAAVLISNASMQESPKRVLEALFPAGITTPGITVLQMTPSLFRQFGASIIRQRILNTSSTLRVLLLGGEPFPSNAELATWMDRQDVLLLKQVCNIYGITEMSCWSMMHVLESLPSRVPLGTPIDDQTTILIRNQDKIKSGCGELFLGSVTRRCYIPQIDDVEKNHPSAIVYRATGDLVKRLKDGSIVYEERANDVVKRAGNRICLGLITRKIENCLHGSEVATCLWQERLQKLICCIRCIEPKTKVQQRAQTFDILSKLLNAEQPDRFVYLQHFPCDAHGKLDRKLLLKECIVLAQPGQDILKSFLHDRLEFVDTASEKVPKKQRLESDSPSSPSGFDLSFRQAGGTSFHAITLCREIGLQMCIDDEQRHLLELLLDENVPLRVVLSFLDSAKLVAHNTKLKPIEPPLDTEAPSSSRPSKLVITRLDQPAINFHFHWKVNFSKCVDSPVAQFEDRFITVGAHSKIVRTLDAVTGEEQSTLRLPDRVECKVTFLSDKLAMVGCYDGCLYGFNPQSGKMTWNINIGGMIKAQPFLSRDRDRIVICSYADDYNVMCLSTERQQVLWCMRVGRKAIFASPLELPRQQAIVICTLDGGYARVSLIDGTVQWAKKCMHPFFASPVLIDANTFACAEVNGQVHACNVNSGQILNSFTAEGNIFSSLVVRSPPTHMGHTFVLFGCIDHHVYCLRCKTGYGKSAYFDLHWKVDVGGSVYATPTLLRMDPNGFFVFCCATDGKIVVANLADGQVQWTEKLHGELFSTPCYIESLRRVYLGCRDNHLYCLGV